MCSRISLVIFMALWTVSFNPCFNLLFSVGFYCICLSVCLFFCRFILYSVGVANKLHHRIICFIFVLLCVVSCLACGSFCDSCELNGVGKCDVDHCNSTGLIPAVVYSNESMSCLRKCHSTHLYCSIYGARKFMKSQEFNAWRPLLSYGSAIKDSVPDRVKPSFVIFDIRALWRSGLCITVRGCQKLHMTA